MKLGPLFRRYSLPVYWLLFAGFTAHQAQYPGLMLNPEQWEYPWRAVLVVWALLAVLVAGLYAILRPRTYNRSWWRLLGGLVYCAVLLWLGLESVVTDMPGYYYVPALFAVATMAGMAVFAVVQVASAVWHRWMHAA